MRQRHGCWRYMFMLLSLMTCLAASLSAGVTNAVFSKAEGSVFRMQAGTWAEPKPRLRLELEELEACLPCGGPYFLAFSVSNTSDEPQDIARDVQVTISPSQNGDYIDRIVFDNTEVQSNAGAVLDLGNIEAGGTVTLPYIVYVDPQAESGTKIKLNVEITNESNRPNRNIGKQAHVTIFHQTRGDCEVSSTIDSEQNTLRLEPIHSSAPDLIRIWRVWNPFDHEVAFTWEIDGTDSDQAGSSIAPPAIDGVYGETYFFTLTEPDTNTVGLYVDAVQQDVAESLPDASVCPIELALTGPPPAEDQDDQPPSDQAPEGEARLAFTEALSDCRDGGSVGLHLMNVGDEDMAAPSLSVELWFTPADESIPIPEEMPLHIEIPALAAGDELHLWAPAQWGAGTYWFVGEEQPGTPDSTVLTSDEIVFDPQYCEEQTDDESADVPDEQPTEEPDEQEPGDAQGDESETEEDPSPEEEPDGDQADEGDLEEPGSEPEEGSGGDQTGEGESEGDSYSEEELEDSPGEEPAEEDTVEETPTEEAPTDVEGVESTE
jgi:hypothetical protein